MHRVVTFGAGLVACSLLNSHTTLAQAPAAPTASVSQPSASETLLKLEELDALVAPIALYPDNLLSLVLIASTYPIEVVQADRFVKENSKLKADELKTALAKQAWDDSIKSPVATPDVLSTYDTKNSVITQNIKAKMIVGNDDYQVPIPMLRTNGLWRFDALAAREEILARRIGQNELAAIQACLAYVDAQNEYAEKDRTGAGVGTYAQRIVSQPEKTDGLYWPASAGEEQSPLGELVAKASVAGRPVGNDRAPYHGYYYKVLTKQGPAAVGGELNFVVNGKMIGGFALIAYPAEYRNSGVMTFMINHSGTIWQKDLGPNTGKLAEQTTSFNPDRSTWQEVKGTSPVK